MTLNHKVVGSSPTRRTLYRINKKNNMSQENLIKLRNKDTGEVLFTRKNKKGENAGKKLELKKFSKKARKHVVFKEAKK